LKENRELAEIFHRIANYLEIEDLPFRPVAYRRAADLLGSTQKDVRKVYQKGGLKDLEALPAIGKSIALNIKEYLETGRVSYLDELKEKIPVDVEGLNKIERIGPKTIKKLYRELGVKTVTDLERVAKEGKIAGLAGFGAKSEAAIIESIEFFERSKDRILLGDALRIADEIIAHLREPGAKIDKAGSLRRMKETIGDIDILTSSKRVMEKFVSMERVEKVIGVGDTKASVRLKDGFNLDLRVVSEESYGSALQHFTGSKDHNIALRKIAINKGLKVSEYGVFRGKERLVGKSEEDVYQILGMDFIPVELREDRGEIELAQKKQLPKLIGYDEIRGDLHCHSSWAGGVHTIRQLALKAKELGYSYIGISDHTKYLTIEKGLNEKELVEQRKEIDKINREFKDFKILQGCEANILKDGSLDIDDKTLKTLDYVIAGIHSHFKMSRDEMTDRMIRAIENPLVDIISHPTGRILGRREEYELDIDKIIDVAVETDTILEINGSPYRLDLNEINIKKAVDRGAKLIINSDAHDRDELELIKLGISQARRGWALKEDIVNSREVTEVLNFAKI